MELGDRAKEILYEFRDGIVDIDEAVQAIVKIVEDNFASYVPLKDFARCREELARLKEELATEKRHWIEDDRDLNELIAENQKLRKALQEICKHQTAVAGSLYPMSTVYNIARRALENK